MSRKVSPPMFLGQRSVMAQLDRQRRDNKRRVDRPIEPGEYDYEDDDDDLGSFSVPT